MNGSICVCMSVMWSTVLGRESRYLDPTISTYTENNLVLYSEIEVVYSNFILDEAAAEN